MTNPSRSNKYLCTCLARVFTGNRTRVQGLERSEGRFPTVWLADLATDKPHRQNGPKLAFPCRQLVVLATYRKEKKRRKLESVHRKSHQLKSLHPCLPDRIKAPFSSPFPQLSAWIMAYPVRSSLFVIGPPIDAPRWTLCNSLANLYGT